MQHTASRGSIGYVAAASCRSPYLSSWSVVQGMLSPMVGSMAESAGLFLSYNMCKRAALGASSLLLSEQNDARFVCRACTFHSTDSLTAVSLSQRSCTYLINAIGGAGSGVCVSLVLTPVEFIKCQMQKQVRLVVFV